MRWYAIFLDLRCCLRGKRFFWIYEWNLDSLNSSLNLASTFSVKIFADIFATTKFRKCQNLIFQHNVFGLINLGHARIISVKYTLRQAWTYLQLLFIYFRISSIGHRSLQQVLRFYHECISLVKANTFYVFAKKP